MFDVGYNSWKFYDWSQITTVVIFGKYEPELMCYAHSRGARVVLKGGLHVFVCFYQRYWANWQVYLHCLSSSLSKKVCVLSS